MISRVMAGLASATLVATALNALPAAASAYTPEQVCGAGFARVAGGTRPVIGNGVIRGHVHLLRSARTGENCVVTIKSSFVGQPTETTATLTSGFGGGGSLAKIPIRILVNERDAGDFKYYAGPV